MNIINVLLIIGLIVLLVVLINRRDLTDPQPTQGLVGGFYQTAITFGGHKAGLQPSIFNIDFSESELTQIDSKSQPLNGEVQSVALNSEYLGIVGGFQTGKFMYAVLTSQNKIYMELNLPSNEGIISSVDINIHGHCIIGGHFGHLSVPGKGYAAFVNSKTGKVTAINLPSDVNAIYSVSINEKDQCLIAGSSYSSNFFNEVYVSVCNYGDISPQKVDIDLGNSSVARSLVQFISVNTNDLGHGVVGGSYYDPENAQTGFASFVNLKTAKSQTINLGVNNVANISSVSLNNLDQCLIGGSSYVTRSDGGVGHASYAAKTNYQSGEVDLITVNDQSLVLVSLNNMGYGLLSSHNLISLLNLSTGIQTSVAKNINSTNVYPSLIDINDKNQIAFTANSLTNSAVFLTSVDNLSIVEEARTKNIPQPTNFTALSLAI